MSYVSEHCPQCDYLRQHCICVKPDKRHRFLEQICLDCGEHRYTGCTIRGSHEETMCQIPNTDPPDYRQLAADLARALHGLAAAATLHANTYMDALLWWQGRAEMELADALLDRPDVKALLAGEARALSVDKCERALAER